MARKNAKGEIEDIPPLQMSILTVLYARCGEFVFSLDLLDTLNEARKKVKRGEVSEGAYYSALRRLQQDGLIEAKWGDEVMEGARKRLYKISSAGAEAYNQQRKYFSYLAGQSFEDELQGGVFAFAVNFIGGILESGHPISKEV